MIKLSFIRGSILLMGQASHQQIAAKKRSHLAAMCLFRLTIEELRDLVAAIPHGRRDL
jgi:hypothetical protein